MWWWYNWWGGGNGGYCGDGIMVWRGSDMAGFVMMVVAFMVVLVLR